MKNKNVLKITFDIIMALLFALMFDTRTTGLPFHEIGGLVLYAMIIIHLVYDRKWIVKVSRLLFAAGYSKKQRIKYLLNILLVIAFLAVGISGIMVSHIVFPSVRKPGDVFLILHIASGIASLILVGIHIGLHWKFIVGVFKNRIAVGMSLGKMIYAAFIIAVFAAGVFCTVTMAPYLASQMELKHGYDTVDIRLNSSGDKDVEERIEDERHGVKGNPTQGGLMPNGARNDFPEDDALFNEERNFGMQTSVNVVDYATTGFLFLAFLLMVGVLAYWFERYVLRVGRKTKE